MRRKAALLALVFLAQAVPFLLVLPVVLNESPTRGEYLESFSQDWFWQIAGIGAGSVALAQTLFLWPVRKPRRRVRGRSLWLSVGVGALTCALLSAAVVFTAISVLDAVLDVDVDNSLGDAAPWALLGCVLFAWVVWTPIIGAFVRRGNPESTLSRLAARLLLGTAVEIIAMVPLDLMVRRKSNCYSLEPSLGALLMCLGVGWFAFGPAVLLPLVARRRKRWYRGHCEACGYDMRGCMKAARCPECGAGWRK